MKEKKIIENGLVSPAPGTFSEEDKAEFRKKLLPGEPEPTTEGGWAVLGSRGMLKEAWEREPIPLPE